ARRLEVDAALHRVAAFGPRQVVDDLEARLDARVARERIHAEVRDARDVDVRPVRRALHVRLAHFAAAVEAEAQLVQQVTSDVRGELGADAVHAVLEGDAAAPRRDTAARPPL